MIPPIEALFCLSPRYSFDDELPWLNGIDPSPPLLDCGERRQKFNDRYSWANR